MVIVSTDKDLMQLVGERVALLDTMKDRRIGPAEVEERFGVPPAQLLDVRALVGDSSDNIPGVKGIGEKGAAELMREWGDLERLLENAAQVKAKKAREALLAQAEEARLSKRLATLRSDVPLPIEPAALGARRARPRARSRELYRRLEFKRLLEELERRGRGAARRGGAAARGRRRAPSAAALARAAEALARSAERLALVLRRRSRGGRARARPGGRRARRRRRRAPSTCPLGGGERCSRRPGCPLAEVAEALRPLLAGPQPRPWLARNSKRVQTLFAEARRRAAAAGLRRRARARS